MKPMPMDETHPKVFIPQAPDSSFSELRPYTINRYNRAGPIIRNRDRILLSLSIQ